MTVIVQPGDVLLYPIDQVSMEGSKVIEKGLATYLPGVTVYAFSGGRAAVVYRPRVASQPAPDIEAAAERAFRAVYPSGSSFAAASDFEKSQLRAMARAVLEMGE